MEKEELNLRIRTDDIENTTEEDVKRSFFFRQLRNRNVVVDINIYKGDTYINKEKLEINRIRMVRLYPHLRYKLNKIINLEDTYISEIIRNTDIDLDVLEMILHDRFNKYDIVKLFSDIVEKHDDKNIPKGALIGTITVDYDTYLYLINKLSQMFYSRYI